MVCHLRFRCALLLVCFAFYIISTPDVTSGFRFRQVCPDNYTLDASDPRCFSTYDDRVTNASVYIAFNDEVAFTRETWLFILGISVTLVTMFFILIFRSVVQIVNHWQEREHTSVVPASLVLPKYERLNKDSHEETKVSATLLLTGTPFYEVDSTQRMIGMRGHII